MASVSHADIVTITALDVRGSGVFGHNPNVTAVTINGGAPSGSATVGDPLDILMTYSNLDMDGDGTANDSVTFTLQATKFGTDGGALRAFNQGIDTGFGNLNDVQVEVVGVSGTTTDFGDMIVFDGFTGAAAGAGTGAGTDLDKNVEINGTLVSIFQADNGAFRFGVAAIDFAATSTVTFDNSGGPAGSIVARHYDLQFSTVPVAIPEPSALALIGMVGGLLALRRRK